MTIEVKNLSKRFGQVAAADDVSLRVEEGSLTALLGPSGSGKTTVLRMIAGLEIPDAGIIEIDGRNVTHLTPQKRNIGFVFQQYALFKHMRVADNIAFPLKVRKWKKDAIRERVSELLTLLRIEGLEKRYPDQVSGGQRQRVALARALAARPEVLLLDEPFSALDARVREELREWLRTLHEQLHVTSVFVTHDQEEAMELADRVVIMRDGVVVQDGSPAEIVESPNSSFVMNFLGRANELSGEALHGVADIEGIRVPYAPANGVALPVTAFFRPQHVDLSLEPLEGAFQARVVRTTVSSLNVKVQLETESGLAIVAELGTEEARANTFAQGQRVYVKPRSLYIYPAAEDDARRTKVSETSHDAQLAHV